MMYEVSSKVLVERYSNRGLQLLTEKLDGAALTGPYNEVDDLRYQ